MGVGPGVGSDANPRLYDRIMESRCQARHIPATVRGQRSRGMSQEFVHYSPEIETLDPDLDTLMDQIIAFWENKVRHSPVEEGSGRATRGAHAKSFGVVRAEVQILNNVPAPYAQGIYATPGRHGAVIRFSSASNHLGADAMLGGVLGSAMKMFDVPGSKLVT